MSKCPCALLRRISIASLTAQTKIVATFMGIIAPFLCSAVTCICCICFDLCEPFVGCSCKFVRVYARCKASCFYFACFICSQYAGVYWSSRYYFFRISRAFCGRFLQKYYGYCSRAACLSSGFIGSVNNYTHAACRWLFCIVNTAAPYPC